MSDNRHLINVVEQPDYQSLKDLVLLTSSMYADKDAFIVKKGSLKNPSYDYITYKRFEKEVAAIGTVLLKRGHTRSKVAVIGKNSYYWGITYLGVANSGNIIVPLDKDLQLEETESSLVRSYSEIMVFDIGKKKLVDQIVERGNTDVKMFICMEPCEGYPCLLDIIDEGLTDIENGDMRFYENEIDPNALGIIIFTSGTTSMAKAVMLSHRNVASNVYSLTSAIKIEHDDVNIALLPFHHTFGLTTAFLVFFTAGACTVFCDGLKYVQKNLNEYKVSVFIGVPLLVESLYKKIMAGAEKKGKTKLINNMRKITGALSKVHIDIRRKVFKEVLEELGGRLRLIIVGASAADPVSLKGLIDFGIEAVQGYGLTETSPVLTVENAKAHKIGSVGKALCNVDIKIVDPDEEGIGLVYAKGPNLMLGYFENDEATEEVIDEKGWFNTGDLGYIDKDGFLFLSGRKKNVIVLHNGKNVFPEELEALVYNLPYVEDCIVCGVPKTKDDPNDMTVCCKIKYDQLYVDEHLRNVDLKELANKDIDEINKTVPGYKRINMVLVTNEPFVKTSTQKIKRYEALHDILVELGRI